MEKFIKVNAEAFIIPIDSFKVKEESDSVQKYIREIANLNNAKISDTAKLVQVWFTSKELGCDNIADHGFIIGQADVRSICNATNLRYVPVCFLKDLKEGDSFTFKAPCVSFAKVEGEENIYVENQYIMEITATCKQLDSRYRNYGKFEDVLNGLVKPAKTESEDKKAEEKKENKEGEKEMNWIEKTWKELPGAAKTGIKIVGAVAVIAAVGFGGKYAYDKYNDKDEAAKTTEDIPEIDDAIVTSGDSDEVVVLETNDAETITIDG